MLSWSSVCQTQTTCGRCRYFCLSVCGTSKRCSLSQTRKSRVILIQLIIQRRDRGAAMEVTKRQMIRSPLNCKLDQSAACCLSSLFDIVITGAAVKGRKNGESAISGRSCLLVSCIYCEEEYSLFTQLTWTLLKCHNLSSHLDFI